MKRITIAITIFVAMVFAKDQEYTFEYKGCKVVFSIIKNEFRLYSVPAVTDFGITSEYSVKNFIRDISDEKIYKIECDVPVPMKSKHRYL